MSIIWLMDVSGLPVPVANMQYAVRFHTLLKSTITLKLPDSTTKKEKKNIIGWFIFSSHKLKSPFNHPELSFTCQKH